MFFTKEVLAWYELNKRDLPWRNTKDPYQIWLSEIILQQTRVNQGLPYFHKFISTFPTISDLANASEDSIFKLWEGLGYYSRAKNLHACAKMVQEQYGGKFPDNYIDLIKLKGIGPYSAAAISSFAFNEVQPVIDGNVFRLMSRFFGLDIPIDVQGNRQIFHKILMDLIPKNKPGQFNQAIMEFGAIQCKIIKPDCEMCPLASRCVAKEKKMVGVWPIKSKKIKKEIRFFNYLFIDINNNIIIQKREGKDIWQNLHEFPMIESDKEIGGIELLNNSKLKEIIPIKKISVDKLGLPFKHLLSHQTIFAQFWKIKGNLNEYKNNKPHILVAKEGLSEYAFPKLINNFMDKNL